MMSMLQKWTACTIIALGLSASGIAHGAQLELLTVEQPGCHWCAHWNAEIAPIYPKSPEGKPAPLRRQMLRAPIPADVTLVSPPVVTPTFILLEDGTEIGRIPGYPGDDFFWALPGQMIGQRPDAP